LPIIVKTTGDGLLIEFSTVTEAVQSALDIPEMAQRNAAAQPGRRLQVRMGINLGEIIIGDGTYTAPASTLRRGLKRSPSPAASASRPQCMSKSRARVSASRILATTVRSFALSATASEAVAFQRIARGHAQGSEAELGSHPRVPSIAVLPFSNLSGDPEQEYFADGIAEDIITALSKVFNLLVISRNSAFAYGTAYSPPRAGFSAATSQAGSNQRSASPS